VIVLIALFAVTALLYASIGFGGGSTYNALLVLHGVDYRVLPAIALACNIIVVTGGVWRFGAAGEIRLRRIAPFIVASVPLAWLGGRLPVSETVFVGLLGGALLIAGLQMLLAPHARTPSDRQGDVSATAGLTLVLSLGAGGALGFLAGVVGIGGGIFLAPVLYFMRWGRPREIAGACSFFILVNSVSGLAGQLTKLDETALAPTLMAYWPLLLAVFLGGQIGSRLGSVVLPERLLKKLTAILMMYVAARLLIRWQNLVG
jgi:uncharacterized membrane protein YfcA